MSSDIQDDYPQWGFYKSLEQDLESCFEYVAPTEAHFDVHSNRFARIILLACIEVENALHTFGAPGRHGILRHYHQVVHKQFPSFKLHEFSIPRFQLKFEPWKGWTQETSPDWWEFGYNKIKHDRMGNPKAPTMLRALESVSALQCLLIHSYRMRFGNWVMPMEQAPTLIWPLHPQHKRISRPMMIWRPDLADDATNPL